MASINRTIASTAVVATAIFLISARSAMSSGQTGGLVRLQSANPGTAQVGHLNINGTATLGGLNLASGAGDGRYLRSNAGGTASWANFPTSLAPSGSAGGDLAGTYPNPTLDNDPNSLAKVSGGAMFTNGSFVGVGTSTQIGSAGFVLNQPVTGFGGFYINTNAAGRPFYGYSANGSVLGYHYVDAADGNKWKLVNGTVTSLTVLPDGKVGIGTLSPTTKLEVSGSTTGSLFRAVQGGASGVSLLNSISVHGDSNAIQAVGVAGTVSGNSAIGVYGKTQGDNSIAVAGYADTSDPDAVGIYGSVAGSGYAGQFQGKVAVVGNLSKGGGSFRIDHPLDPANKYLYHSFVESPDMMNIYNGTVTTDERGYATVTMPRYFEALNRDFRYQLTVVDESDGDWTMARVVRKIKGGQFTLRTSTPHAEVSWQVTGIRQDDFANANRIEVEVDKEPRNKGKYLYPTAAGMPEELSILPAQLRNGARIRTKK